MNTSNIVSKSTLVYPQRQGTTFRAQDQIEFYIPPSLHLINTKSTFLLCDVNMTGNLKKAPSTSAGFWGMVKQLQVSSGDGSVVYETLNDIAVQQAVYYYYTKIEGNNLRELHEGKPSSDVLGFESANQYCNGLATTAAEAHKKVEVCVPLYMVGCLTPLREKIFPNIATGGLRLLFTLNTAEEALQVIKTRVGVANFAEGAAADSATRKPVISDNLTRDNQGGYSVNFQCSATGGNQTLVLDRQFELSADSFRGVNRAMMYNVKGAADAPKVSHPFLVGQSVIQNADGESRKIVGISQDADGKILLDLTDADFGNIPAGTGKSLRIDTSTANNPNENFEINNLRLQVSYAVASEVYMDAVMTSIAENKMTIDIQTWTDYAQNISANSLQNQLYIKSVNSRAKSIISVPLKVGSGQSILEDSYQPDQQNCQDYQYVLYNVLTPNRPVRLERFVKKYGDERASYDGSALKEMSGAITAAGYPLNNVKFPHRHFFVGRKLANKDYSYNMNKEGDVRLSLSFDSTGGPDATLVHNCVHHIRRITIGAGGQMVSL